MTGKKDMEAFRGRELLHRISNSVLARKRNLLFSTVYKRYLTMLDRIEYGFIPEVKYFKSKLLWFIAIIYLKQHGKIRYVQGKTRFAAYKR